MKTSITLDQEKLVYRPGDRIKGAVKLSVPSTAEITKIVVSLRGIAQTHIVFVKYWHSQSNFKKQVCLFEREQTIFTGPYTVKSGDHEWPFEFTIPERCEKNDSQPFQDKKSSIFDDDPDQDLPPAVSEIVSKNFNTSGNSFFINYPLTASISIGKVIGSKEEQIVRNLNIQPWRDMEHPTWRTLSQVCKFETFIGDAPEPSKKLSGIFKRRSSIQQVANFKFALHAKIATIVIVGKPIPMFLSLQHDSFEPPGSSSKSKALNFNIKSITATLSTDNVVRSQGSQQELYLSGAPETLWTDTMPIGSKLSIAVPIENGDTLDVRNLMPDFGIPNTEPPSFSSFSVCRLHEMNIKVEIECNNQSFTASYSTKRTIVLPEHFRSDSKPRKGGEDISQDTATDPRNDSFAETTAVPTEAPPSFNAALNEAEELPGYTRDGTY